MQINIESNIVLLIEATRKDNGLTYKRYISDFLLL